MKIVIAGGTGFIGGRLTQRLLDLDHEVIILSRREMDASISRFPKNVKLSWLVWDGRTPEALLPAIDGASAVLNFAGESLAGKRWTETQKMIIFDSRIETTRLLVSAIGRAGHPPKVLLNASAVGFYGNVPEGDVTESFPKGKDYLADLCAQWELESLRAEKFGVRVVLLRSGIVLDTFAGTLPKLLLPFRFFLGGHFGSGKQWFPWIHILDEVNAILFALNNENISGAVNLCAPGILRQKDFCALLGRILHRPSVFSIPAAVLKVFLGETAELLLLQGQKAVPKKLTDSGFKFSFTECEEALKNLAG
jgi:uncharacterized protein (TIGR01777 family)